MTSPFANLHLPVVDSKRKSRVVAERLIGAFQEGRYKPEEKLPAERVLAEQMGVSRGVVREALSALQLAGLIEIRVGEGSFVKTPGPLEDGGAQAISILEHNDSPLELWEARRELEISIVRLASTLATPAHIENIEARLEDMRSAARSRDLPGYLRANDQFHQALMSPTENSVLTKITTSLIESTNQLLTLESVHRYLESDLAASLQKHVAIYEAFVKQDADMIRGSITHHFNELIKFFLRG